MFVSIKGGEFLERVVMRKTLCLRRLGERRGTQLGAGRFLANPKVTAEQIVASWPQRTAAACAGRHVLAIEDASHIRFPTTADRRRGLGPVKQGNVHGLMVHAVLAVDADSHACLGLVGGTVWNRPGVNPVSNKQRALDDRESLHWLDGARQAGVVLAQAAMVTVVADREADMYALWAQGPADNRHLLIRATRDRALADGGRLYAAATEFAPAGVRRFTLPARDPGKPKRDVVVELRYGEVEIRRPEQERDRALPASVRLRLIEVVEPEPGAAAKRGDEPIHWRLLTTHTIDDAEQAWRIVDWYRARWVIEQLFRAMKSQGLQLEDSQLATAEGLRKLTAIAVKAACIDIQLTQERDGCHKLPAGVVFSAPEIETIEALVPSLEGNTDKQKNPHRQGTLARASWVIARLGCWNCYGKPPGPITFRRGMQQFYAIHRGRELERRLKRDVRIP